MSGLVVRPPYGWQDAVRATLSRINLGIAQPFYSPTIASRGSAPQEMSAWAAPPEMGRGLSKNNERNKLNKALFIIIRKKDFCVIIK
jgi:hypothetical protein